MRLIARNEIVLLFRYSAAARSIQTSVHLTYVQGTVMSRRCHRNPPCSRILIIKRTSTAIDGAQRTSFVDCWVNGLVHRLPAFPCIDDQDAELFRTIDLSGTAQVNDQRLCYFAAEQIIRDVAPCVLEEIGLHTYADRMRALPRLVSRAAAQKASDLCFEIPQSASLNSIDRRTLSIGTVVCALSALPTSNWFYAMSNAGQTASIYINTSRNHARALTTVYELFSTLVEFARAPAFVPAAAESKK